MYKSGLAMLILTALSSVQAHYQLTYPQSRGFIDSSEPVAPCGGFNTVNTTRTEFPLKNGFLEINSEHVQYQYTVNLVLNSNPSAADFSSQNASVASGSNSFPEQACLPVDLSKLSGAVDGTPATFQIVYNAGDGTLYQCADVVLKTTPAGWNTTACFNANTGSNSSQTSSSASPSSSSGSKSASSSVTMSASLVAMCLALAAVSQL